MEVVRDIHENVHEILEDIAKAFDMIRLVFSATPPKEEVIRGLFQEILLYENLIETYSAHIRLLADPRASPYFAAIELFHRGITGIQALVQSSAQPKGMLAKAMKVCTTWAYSAANKEKIEAYGNHIQRAASLLNFSASALILKKLENLGNEQVQMAVRLDSLVDSLSKDRQQLDYSVSQPYSNLS